MSKLDLTHFKKVSSDGNSTTLRHSKDHHEIKINHATVPPGVLDGLSRLKVYGYADGGSVKSDEEIRKIAEDAARKSLVDSGYGYKAPQPYSVPKKEEPPTISPEEGNKLSPLMERFNPPIMPQVQRVPSQTLGDEEDLSDEDAIDEEPDLTDTTSTPDQQSISPSSAGSLKKSLNDKISGAKMIAAAQTKLADETQKLEEKNIADHEQAKLDYDAVQNPLIARGKALNEWLVANPENADNYIKNMSTGGKIATAIGLLLGGIGASSSQGQNLAYKYLEHQIDQDLESQRSNINTHKGLLSHNLQEMGRIDTAYTLSKMQKNEIMASKLRNEAAKAKKQEIAGSLLQLSSKFTEDNLLLNSKLVRAGLQSKDDAKIIKEVNSRNQLINTNVDEAIKMIESKGTSEQFGEHNKILNGLMDDVAIDMAKMKDPNSAALPGEVESARRSLIEAGVFQQDKTAIKVLQAIKERADVRLRSAYSVRGMTPPAEIKSIGKDRYQKVPGGWKKIK